MSELQVSKFASAGNAPVLVLLHGWGSSSKIWQPLIPKLAKASNVWCVDLPGHGENHDIDWDGTADQGVELLANALPKKCVLVGWSLGGLLAQLFAKHYPHRVHSLMLVASTPKFIAGPDWPHAMSADTFASFVNHFDVSPQATMKNFIALQSLHSKSSKQCKQALTSAMSIEDLDTIQWGLQWLQNLDLRDTFLEEAVSIDLLQGENDQVSFLKAAKHTADIWKHAQLHKIAEAGHAPFLSHPEQFVEQVRSMLANIETEPC